VAASSAGEGAVITRDQSERAAARADRIEPPTRKGRRIVVLPPPEPDVELVDVVVVLLVVEPPEPAVPAVPVLLVVVPPEPAVPAVLVVGLPPVPPPPVLVVVAPPPLDELEYVLSLPHEAMAAVSRTSREPLRT
jgi:hypothetical protein